MDIYYIGYKSFFNYSFIQNKIFIIEKTAYFTMYLSLKNILLEKNTSLIKKEKQNILDLFSIENSNISFIDKIFYTSNYNFGNILVNLNKLIFYCEIIGCKSIILDKNIFWFIKNTIQIPINNMTIGVGNYNSSLYFFNDSDKLLFSSFLFRKEIRLNFLRNEIISNLPIFYTSKDDLYIHIRSGDIFTFPNKYYSQPPLCFYQNILYNNKFKNIYLITFDTKNPVIKKLINQFSNIIYTNDSLENDISKLIYAYNVVASISSFLNLIIQLNYNLKFLWDFNIYKTSEKILLYHYDLYKFPYHNFTIFRMEPSNQYREIMYNWKNNKIQNKLMVKEKCQNYFSLINKEI